MFADILKGLRSEMHISQGKLAESIGVSAGNVSTWESGESKPGYVALCALARFFGVSADYLLELSPQKKGNSESEHHSFEEIEEKQILLRDGDSLEDEEIDLIAMYRRLPDYKKEDAFDIIQTLYQKHVERKKESIYWTYKEDKLKQKGKVDSDGGSQGGIA